MTDVNGLIGKQEDTPRKRGKRRAEKERWTYRETGRQSDAGGQRDTEKPGGHPKMEQRVIGSSETGPELRETGNWR
jgi:hypothetical protein